MIEEFDRDTCPDHRCRDSLPRPCFTQEAQRCGLWCKQREVRAFCGKSTSLTIRVGETSTSQFTQGLSFVPKCHILHCHWILIKCHIADTRNIAHPSMTGASHPITLHTWPEAKNPIYWIVQEHIFLKSEISPMIGRFVCGSISDWIRAEIKQSDWSKNGAAENSSICRQ